MCSNCSGDYENPEAAAGPDQMQDALQVAFDLQQVGIKVMCAWHPKNFGAELVMREGAEPASHGICEDCRERIGA